MKKRWPKTLFVKQITNATGKSRTFRVIMKTSVDESRFRQQAANMGPNFTNEIREKLFA